MHNIRKQPVTLYGVALAILVLGFGVTFYAATAGSPGYNSYITAKLIDPNNSTMTPAPNDSSSRNQSPDDSDCHCETTPTPTPSATATSTSTPTNTPTPTNTYTPTNTSTPTNTPTQGPIYLPLILQCFTNFFGSSFEIEPNNSYLQANGPLQSGSLYQGYPNDAKDYFSIFLCSPGEIKVDLTNHSGDPVQLQLFYKSTANRVAYDTRPPYSITYTGAAGIYYIYIFTGANHNATTLYNLMATYP